YVSPWFAVSEESKFLPFLFRDSGFAKNGRQKVSTDVAAMRIGNRKRDLAADHEFVATLGKWPPEAGAVQGSNKIPPLDRAKRRHQATFRARARVALPAMRRVVLAGFRSKPSMMGRRSPCSIR